MPNKTNSESESTESPLQGLLGTQAEELRALEHLLSQFVSWGDLEEIPSDNITRATFLEMAQMAEAAPDEYQPQVGDYLATALDVGVTASANGFTSIEVLFSTGGPGIWLE